jgi:hypothetical protein
MKGTGRNDGFYFAFNFFNEFFFSEAITVSTDNEKGIIISIKTDSGKSGASEIVTGRDDDLADAVLEFVDTDFIGYCFFLIDFGEFWKVVGRGTINGGRIFKGQ